MHWTAYATTCQEAGGVGKSCAANLGLQHHRSGCASLQLLDSAGALVRADETITAIRATHAYELDRFFERCEPAIRCYPRLQMQVSTPSSTRAQKLSWLSISKAPFKEPMPEHASFSDGKNRTHLAPIGKIFLEDFRVSALALICTHPKRCAGAIRPIK